MDLPTLQTPTHLYYICLSICICIMDFFVYGQNYNTYSVVTFLTSQVKIMDIVLSNIVKNYKAKTREIT